MSEYQYYEFQTIDRPLTEDERVEIGSWSSRTRPTSTQAIFTYSYGDFPKSPEQVVGKYFDAMLYVANWGSKRLMFRFPRTVVDEEMLRRYCLPDMVTISILDDYLVLDINFDDEESDNTWMEGEGWLTSLIILRNDILNGDYRMLYLAWLKAVSLLYDIDNIDDNEPPIPYNLRKLSAALKNFIEFFEIDNALITVASKKSATTDNQSKLGIEQAVRKLSEDERMDYLIRVAKGEPHIVPRLLKRLQELSIEIQDNPDQNLSLRTVREILAAAQELSTKRQEQEKLRAEQEKIRKLEELSRQENALWENVSLLIDQKQSKAYDQAVKILLQLRELAEYREQVKPFQAMVEKIYKDYSRLSGLKVRLQNAGLI